MQGAAWRWGGLGGQERWWVESCVAVGPEGSSCTHHTLWPRPR